MTDQQAGNGQAGNGHAEDEFDPQSVQWLHSLNVDQIDRAVEDWRAVMGCGANAKSIDALQQRFVAVASQIDDMSDLIHQFRQFVTGSSDPQILLERFEEDESALPSMLKFFSSSPTLSRWVVEDPDVCGGVCDERMALPTRSDLIQQIVGDLQAVDQTNEAASVINRLYSRELVRAAYQEFAHGLSPDAVGRQLANVADAIVEGALQFVVRRAASRRGMPQRSDGTIPELTVLGLGNLGGQEMSYSSPLKLIFFYDSIDSNNLWHREFYQSVVSSVVDLLMRDRTKRIGFDVDLRNGPRYEVGVHICSYREAIRIYETAGRTSQRLSFAKARFVAGSASLGSALLERLQSWIYPRFLTRADLAEIGTLQHKLEKRSEQLGFGNDVAKSSGGRDDLERAVQFLQLLHGSELLDVRCSNTYEAIAALERGGCLKHDEATLLSENYARLCRLQHLLTLKSERHETKLPEDPGQRGRIAWQLGVRSSTNPREGDLQRFEQLLSDTFEKNRKLVNHLMLRTLKQDDEVAVEMELVLDPDPDPDLVDSTMRKHGLTDPRRAMHDLVSLSTESVTFLSPHRCRHLLSSIAPTLLTQISRTPDPDEALASLVKVTDSLGAKATLWELLGNSEPTMELMVRLCATTPYLSGILTNNPGMIDELIDSLLMNRLPSADRLDAHSIELCRGAAEIEKILHSFKISSHLMIGVRDMLGKESLEATHQAIGDTAEACLRRFIDYHQADLAERFGDPVDDEGEPVELVALGLGKLGGREPNYHSDLDAVFLYSAEGETQRRVGGHRSTLSNEQFFSQLAQRIVSSMNDPSYGGRLYELDSRLRDSGDEGVWAWAMNIDQFLDRFRQNTAPLWQRLALCKARSISGSRRLRAKTDAAVTEVIVGTQWRPEMVEEIRSIRDRMAKTARAENLKRGEGGTMDVELVAQALTLRFASSNAEVIRPGTIAAMTSIRDAGLIDDRDANQLIDGYRTLRGMEANLRLMNTPARHELPEDPHMMRNLAFLMNQSDPSSIVSTSHETRKAIRTAYNRVLDSLASD
ncbi:MAG: glutamate-ammonia-ligase adenylyltransferase [Planctomycetota bacterium]